jgi:hypothetical protein
MTIFSMHYSVVSVVSVVNHVFRRRRQLNRQCAFALRVFRERWGKIRGEGWFEVRSRMINVRPL